MKWLSAAALVIACGLHASSAALTPSSGLTLQESVAIVCSLTGKAVARIGNQRIDVRLFQRLIQGTSLETDIGSSVVLALFTGDRYQLGEEAVARLGRTGLESQKGPIRRLSPVPAMVDIAPIAREEKPGTRLAGTRIRGEATGPSFMNLYPSEGASAFARDVFLRFDPVDGYQRYRVELEGQTASALFSVETASTAVQIPSGVLQHGASYYWRVRTLDPDKPAVRGEAVFSTLSVESERRRAALAAHVDAAGDSSLRALLAEFDRSVGLHREACLGLETALAQNSDNRAIADALTRFGCGPLRVFAGARK